MLKKQEVSFMTLKMAAPQLGWIGLGSMGIGMSKNLQKHLSISAAPPLIFTNRTLSRGDSLKALGATPVKSVGDVAKMCDVIFSCVMFPYIFESKDNANNLFRLATTLFLNRLPTS